MSDIAAIEDGLTEAQRDAILWLPGKWTAGPTMSDDVLAELTGLRDLGLLERHFMDEGPSVYSIGEGQLSVHLSSCWHFRLTGTGLRVRAMLLGGRDG